MNRIKQLFCVTLLMAAALPLAAQNAGTWSGLQTTRQNGGTNAIVANTTNVLPAIRLDFPRTENGLLWVNFKLAGSGTSNVEWIFARGTDDGYETNANAIIKWNVAANGTTSVCGITNISLGATPHLWLISQGHNNANAVTNLDMRYGFKR